MEWIETTGSTVDEAKDRALDRLGIAEDDMQFEIIEEGSSSLFRLKRKEARLRARVKPVNTKPTFDRRSRNKNQSRGGKNTNKSGNDRNTNSKKNPKNNTQRKVIKRVLIIIKPIRMRQTIEKSAILISNLIRKEVLKQILKGVVKPKRLWKKIK